MKNFYWRNISSFLILLVSLNSWAANETDEFRASFNQHQTLVAAEKYAEALPFAKKSYELAKQVFKPLNADRLLTIDNYALNLQVTGKPALAKTLFIELLTAYEKKYGKHDRKLLPVLTDITNLNKQLKDTVDVTEAKETAIRQYKLYLRHNSDTFISQFADDRLPTTQHATNTLTKVRNKLGDKYAIHESDHWSIIYPKKKLKFIKKHMVKVMERTYQNNLSFLISLGLRNKPIEDKMTAVYFANKSDYSKYHKAITGNKFAAVKSTSSYHPKQKAIFMYDRGKNKKGKNKHVSPHTVVFDVSLQVFHQTGLLPKTVIFPKWVRKGLAISFQTTARKAKFGPHHNNFRFKHVSLVQDRYEAGTLSSLETLVSFDGDQEAFKNRKNSFDVSIQGSMLIRFLYAYYPDEFKDYLNIIYKTRTTKYERPKFGKNLRLKQFKKAFGEPEAMQAQYNAFLEQLFSESAVAYKAYKLTKKQKKLKKMKPKNN